jgi:deazaflavin-dependent oxidoreductase (nitroreductase family)
MPLPKSLARFNLVVTNPVARRVAGRLPGFAIVTHVGRRSGRTYRTPVNLFRAGERYVIPLTYGSDSQWVRNVVAAGECEVETRGERIDLVAPEVVHDPRREFVPAAVRPILGWIGVDDFMVLRPFPPRDRETLVPNRPRSSGGG